MIVRNTFSIAVFSFLYFVFQPAYGDDIIGFQARDDAGASVRMVPAAGGSDTPVYQDRFPDEVSSPPYLSYRGSWDPQWLPDGKRVVIKLNIMDSSGARTKGRVLFLASAPIPRRANRLQRVTPDDWEAARQYAVSPDGKHVAFFGVHGESTIEPGVRCLDRTFPPPPDCSKDLSIQPIDPIGTPRVIWVSGDRGFRTSRPAWSRDSSMIAFTRQSVPEDSLIHDLYVVPATGGEAMLIAEGVTGREPIISWSLDGTALAYATSSTAMPGIVDIVLIDLQTLAITNLTQSRWQWAFNPVFSPDGLKIGFFSAEVDESFNRQSSGTKVVVYDTVGGTFQVLASDAVVQDWMTPSWSSDSQSLAYAYGGDKLGIAVAGMTGSPRYLTLPKYDHIAASFRPTIAMPGNATMTFNAAEHDLLSDTLSVDVSSTRLGNLFLLGPEVRRVRLRAGEANVTGLARPVSATVCSQRTGFCASHN